MSGQSPDLSTELVTTPAAEQSPAGTPSIPAIDPAALQRQIEALASELKQSAARVHELSQESADRRVKARDAEQARIDAEKVAGNLKPALEAIEAERAALLSERAALAKQIDDLKPAAEKYQAISQRRRAELDEGLKTIADPLAKRSLEVLAERDPDEAFEHLARYRASQAGASSTRPAATAAAHTAAAPALQNVDAKALPLEDLRAALRDPQRKDRTLASLGVSAKPTSRDPFGRPL